MVPVGGCAKALVLIDHTDLGDKLAADPTGPEVLHYVRDALGSVVGLVDAGDPQAQPPVLPALVERYDYDPYGKTYIESGDGLERRAASRYGNPYAWTGQRYDAGVGTYHFAFRSYSPELGRWLQRDPLGYVDGPNLYEYVRSSPAVWADPLGLVAGPPEPPDWGGGWHPPLLPPDGDDEDGPMGPPPPPGPCGGSAEGDSSGAPDGDSADPGEDENGTAVSLGEYTIDPLLWPYDPLLWDHWAADWLDMDIYASNAEVVYDLNEYIEEHGIVILFNGAGWRAGWLSSELAKLRGDAFAAVNNGEELRALLEAGYRDVTIIAHGSRPEDQEDPVFFPFLMVGYGNGWGVGPDEIARWDTSSILHVEIYACYQGYSSEYGDRDEAWEEAFPNAEVDTYSGPVFPALWAVWLAF